MDAAPRIVGIVGSYRKHGTIDTAVAEVLRAAEVWGANTQTIYLHEQQIEFCTNCRHCLQEPGSERGECLLQDDMDAILRTIEAADGLVIGAPVNFGNVNALTRRFLERTVCYGYWPWEARAPKLRQPQPSKKAVLISSSAAPGLMARFLTGAFKALKELAKMLGAKSIGVLWIGLVDPQDATLSERQKRRARELGQRLASAVGGRHPVPVVH